ncbi:hypothetical protein SBA4_3550015 [Candidatus Sulfopaludibacter sp. SbA4]|nr:hypothetical protein SBA4_3550015 [Candidatus Sulfopaludibacter sp. SbA4]
MPTLGFDTVSQPREGVETTLVCTVGFYNDAQGPAHILAVRSLFPRRR